MGEFGVVSVENKQDDAKIRKEFDLLLRMLTVAFCKAVTEVRNDGLC